MRKVNDVDNEEMTGIVIIYSKQNRMNMKFNNLIE